MRKCCKSDLVKQFENEVSPVLSLPDFDPSLTTYIRDGMAIVQCMDAKKHKTFGDLALAYYNYLASCFKKAHTVADVFDRYDVKQSIKSGERERRTKVTAHAKVFQVIEGRNVPDWKKFLSVKENKQALIKFFGDFLVKFIKSNPLLVLPGHTYYMAGSFEDPEIAKVISDQEVVECPELFSTQEEADTRMILQALHADKRLKEIGKKGRIIIKSSDTDVIVLCIHFFKQMTNTSEFWIQMGNIGTIKDNRRFLPIHQLCSSLHEIICRVLPAVHALSGFDTTSSLFGIGKKSVYKVLKDAVLDFSDLNNLGDSDTETAILCSRRFVARLYDQKKKYASCHQDINKLRVKLATSKDSSLVRLPPSEAALRQHILRASFQTKIWHDSCLAKPPLPSPLEYEWKSFKVHCILSTLKETCQQIFFMTSCVRVRENHNVKSLSIKIASDAVLIGKDIVLTCTVHGIENIDRKTTRQWSMGNDDELLCYNGRINNRRKYKENVLAANEFSLTIINVTKVDLNVLYQCRYGFDAASKFIEEDEPILFLSLRLVNDFIIFGGYIILTCTVNGISALDSDVTRQWSMGSDDQLLSYNGRINNHRKYEETILPGNEFSLRIFNVTEKDVNITYRCRYGFDSANTFIEMNEYNYVNPPTPKSTTITYFLEKEMDTINISVYFKRVFPLPNCSVDIDAPNFDITDLREYEVVMELNLSLRLQRRVTCNRSFNISCHIGRKQYDVGYLTLKDECSLEHVEGMSRANIIMIILLSALVVSVIWILKTVLVIAKSFVLEGREHQMEGKWVISYTKYNKTLIEFETFFNIKSNMF
ncbi:unnamed protein product [Mytilus coruscus]|uniref:Ig-like domain-containing protein n=1 Tax=Mytilus coruscus TaxID=42192 RepID=A0A6J8EJR2_MYTCO|nr:unnamed protein product [Mytilus coruscus]